MEVLKKEPLFVQNEIGLAGGFGVSSGYSLNSKIAEIWKAEGYGGGGTSNTYTPVEYKGTTKVDGQTKDISRRVYQRSDIDWNRVDPETGLTNIELMKKGRPPYWKDGTKVELHHTIQLEPGPMVELPASLHDEYSKILHGLVENGGSFRNNPVLEKQYNNFRSKYWRWRAKQIEGKE
ncbi:hypothetical protein GON22_18130 [Paenibacillus sp. MMS18-CY102]|nr:hypothetical protein [Paenibacillus sp. MMS18-CY102]